jgi:predicted metal-dependent hydrolase
MFPPPSDVCAQSPSSTLLLAVRQFNDGAYFTCHETLEELWFVESIPLRSFYQGLLKVAVGLNHLRRGNESGAISLLTSGANLLRPFAPVCLQIDVAALLPGVEQVLETLAVEGLERTLALADQLFPRIVLVKG